MRPLEQYVTLRRGREVFRRQEEEEWVEQARQSSIVSRRLAHWLAMRLVRWGYKLERYSEQITLTSRY